MMMAKYHNFADPDAEVVALSPKTLMESDRFICEICNQGFQRDQNLQMHRRRHKVTGSILCLDWIHIAVLSSCWKFLRICIRLQYKSRPVAARMLMHPSAGLI
jgi:hypothetical protein